MATARNPISAGLRVPIATAPLVPFDEALFQLARQYFPHQIARSLRPRVRELAKNIAAGPPEKPPAETIRLVLSPAMKTMASRRKISVNSYLHEIADADLAEYHSLTLATEALGAMPVRKLEERSDVHRTRTNARMREKIIEARDVHGLSIAKIAERFQLSVSSVNRILVREDAE
jgi:DNA-directed RNA polymerase specialized sigma24 family protein